MKGWKGLSLFVLGTLVTLGLPMAGDAQQCPKGTIKLVTSWPMQGAMLPEGMAMKRAVDLAVEHYGGAVAGYCIKVINEDDASPVTGSWDRTIEAEIAQRAVADKDVMVYLGTYNSGAAKISSPITNKAGLAQVTPANTYPGLTKPGFHPGEPDIYRPSGKVTYFRTHPADDIQGAAGAAWAACLGYKRVYVLDDRQLYGKGIADVFAKKAKALGLQVLGQDGVESVNIDFRALLTKVRASGAELIYGGFVIDSGGVQVIQQMKALGMFPKIKFMGPDDLYSPGLIEQATPAVVNNNVLITYAGFPPEALPTKVGQKFYKDFLAKYKEKPIGWAMYAYNAAIVALDAVKRAGVKDRGKIMEAVRNTKDFEGVTGNFSFDRWGDTTRTDMGAFVVEDWKWKYLYTINGEMYPKNCPKITAQKSYVKGPPSAGPPLVAGPPYSPTAPASPPPSPPVAPPPAPREDRFYNAWFEGDHFANLRPSILLLGRRYAFGFNIGKKRDREGVLEPRPVPQPYQEGGKTLEVTLTSPSFEPVAQTQNLHLPKEGDSATVTFEIKAIKEGDSRADIIVSYQNEAFDKLTFEIKILDDKKILGQPLVPSAPQSPDLPKKVPARPDLDRVEGKDSEIILSYADPDGELWVCIKAAGNPPCGRARITPRQVETELRSLRKTLYLHVNKRQALRRDSLADLAVHGSKLYRSLFEADNEVKTAMDLLKSKASSSRPLNIQIVELSQKTYIPWQLLYDDENFKSYEKERFKKDAFWGYKYILDYRPNGPGTTYDLETEIDSCRSLHMVFASYRGDPRLQQPLADQRRFLDRATTHLTRKEYNEKLPFLKFLEGSDRGKVSLLYFFTHATNGREVTDQEVYLPKPEDAAINFSATEELKPRDLIDLRRSLATTKDPVLQGLPIVFINACESSAVHTYDYDKFIEAFAQLGIRGLIGTETEINISDAEQFGVAFWEQVFQGKSIGHTLYHLRRNLLDTADNPIGLLYSYFGNPAVSLKCLIPLGP